MKKEYTLADNFKMVRGAGILIVFLLIAITLVLYVFGITISWNVFSRIGALAFLLIVVGFVGDMMSF